MAGVICYHGVKAAARDDAICKIAQKEGTIPRSVIMDWLESSPEYSVLATQMKSKVESMSYKRIVSKALDKAGYTRVEGEQYSKWLLLDDGGNESELSDDSDDSDDEKEQGGEAEKAPIKPTGLASLHARMEPLSAQELLAEFKKTVDAGQWSRHHQIMANVICVHGVKAAARDKAIRKIAQEGGVPTSAIKHWLENTPKYSMWATQMKKKVLPISYQKIVSDRLLTRQVTAQPTGWNISKLREMASSGR